VPPQTLYEYIPSEIVTWFKRMRVRQRTAKQASEAGQLHSFEHLQRNSANFPIYDSISAPPGPIRHVMQIRRKRRTVTKQTTFRAPTQSTVEYSEQRDIVQPNDHAAAVLSRTLLCDETKRHQIETKRDQPNLRPTRSCSLRAVFPKGPAVFPIFEKSSTHPTKDVFNRILPADLATSPRD
jgi:hypothetical protein